MAALCNWSCVVVIFIYLQIGDAKPYMEFSTSQRQAPMPATVPPPTQGQPPPYNFPILRALMNLVLNKKILDMQWLSSILSQIAAMNSGSQPLSSGQQLPVGQQLPLGQQLPQGQQLSLGQQLSQGQQLPQSQGQHMQGAPATTGQQGGQQSVMQSPAALQSPAGQTPPASGNVGAPVAVQTIHTPANQPGLQIDRTFS